MVFNVILNSAVIVVLMLQVGTQPGKWRKVKDYAVHYSLPNSWSSDPFSYSSVCDCPGTINDNGGWEAKDYVGMVIYPAMGDDITAPERQQVWGHPFQPSADVYKIRFGDILYQAVYGTFEGMKGQPRVWQLVSPDNPRDRYPGVVVYFWATDKKFKKNQLVFQTILESFELQKVR